MTTSRTFAPVIGKVIRVTGLTANGDFPPSGTANKVVTDGYIGISLTAEVEDGTEILTKKANGAFCVNVMTSPAFKRYTAEIEFCEVDPAVLSLVSNARSVEDWAAELAGIAVPEGTIDSRFALEIWTGISGAASAPGVEASGYFLLPYVHSGSISDLEINGENSVTFTVAGMYTESPNKWDDGPYNVLDNDGTPDKLADPVDPYDHMYLIRTNVTPPALTNGIVPMES